MVSENRSNRYETDISVNNFVRVVFHLNDIFFSSLLFSFGIQLIFSIILFLNFLIFW